MNNFEIVLFGKGFAMTRSLIVVELEYYMMRATTQEAHDYVIAYEYACTTGDDELSSCQYIRLEWTLFFSLQVYTKQVMWLF